ncbi:hypothetical protein B0H17DRAFT_1032348 [Mycena rosella]|uniref:C2H2-type domain-containing protein n=1 Tax=Mycena rosella TaxID=1033263 RepID=A0AAD7GX66_MYCRO|nr:hypothetical protein B0H17DRAFT_1032348 [Mycena rosella]
MDGTDHPLVGNGISITPPTPPPNERMRVCDHEWRSPASAFGSPGDSPYSPALTDSPFLNSPMGYTMDSTTVHSPRPELLHLQTGWNAMTLEPNPDTSTVYSAYQYPAFNANGPTPLSPVLDHLPLLGSDSPKPRYRWPENSYDTSPVLAHDLDLSQDSVLLFGPTPLPRFPSDEDHSAFARRMSATSSTHPDMRALMASGPRRHSFNGPQQVRFFLPSESSPSALDTSSSSFPPSPDTSGAASPELVITHPQVASPANVQASNARRKKPGKYHCSHCPSSFTAKHNLKNHLHSHMGIKPHACDACGSRYTTSAVQKRHFKTCQIRLSSS